MATFEITSPDGAKYQVTAPDGATNDQIMQFVQMQSAPSPNVGMPANGMKYSPAQMAQLNAARDSLRAAEASGLYGPGGTGNPASTTQPQSQQPQPTDNTSPLQAALIGAGRGFTQLGRGVEQAYYGLTGDQAAQDALKARSDEESRLYQPLAQAHPFATAVGEGAPVIAGGPLTMAAAGALEYGTPEEKAARAAAGFVGGKLGQYGGKLIGRVAQPIRGMANDAIDATKAAFANAGADALPGQITGSVPLQWLESTIASLPGGGRVRDVLASQQTALNKGVMSAAGAAGDAVTPEAVDKALAASGGNIGSLTQPIAVDLSTNNYQLFKELGVVKDRYTNKLDALQKPVIQNLIDDIEKQGNTMSGEFYQNTRSDIAKMARGASGSYQNALTGIYKALDRAFDRSAPQDVADMVRAARGQYRAGLTAEKLATPTGDVSPVRVANAFAGDSGPTGDLAQYAARIRSLPNSGTAQRLIYQGLLSGGLGAGAGLATGDPTEALKYAGGSFVAPWLAAQLLTRAPLRNYLTNTVVSPELYNLLGRVGGSAGGLLGLSRAQ